MVLVPSRPSMMTKVPICVGNTMCTSDRNQRTRRVRFVRAEKSKSFSCTISNDLSDVGSRRTNVRFALGFVSEVSMERSVEISSVLSLASSLALLLTAEISNC